MAVIPSAFRSPSDETSGRGIRPVVFDIVAPDGRTSLLNYLNPGPGDFRLVLHVNPNTMSISYTKMIERIETKGGFVEQHWGDGTQSISLDMSTGGFMRLYTGMANITGDGLDLGGNRRETIAYDKYLDMLALFENNGMIRDLDGNPIFDGKIKMTFDGQVFYGWFENFSVSEDAESPYQFTLSTSFVVSHEMMTFKSTLLTENITSGFATETPNPNIESANSTPNQILEPSAAAAADDEPPPTGASEELPPSEEGFEAGTAQEQGEFVGILAGTFLGLGGDDG